MGYQVRKHKKIIRSQESIKTTIHDKGENVTYTLNVNYIYLNIACELTRNETHT